ncbi:MAG TPA: hypothetical protein VLN48_22245 [Bryobacteraceae bacterium]|nr:hypothetical protein [Bryobacteraceae bacterium]
MGVLLSRWEAIALAPQEDGPGRFVQRRYIRGTGQAIQVLETSGDAGDQKASVIMHGLENLNPIEETPGKTWYKFFPSVEFGKRETFQYPIPYSDEFCQLYSERVIDFCQAARYFSGAAKFLTARPEPSIDNTELARTQALEAMNLLRRSVTSILDLDEAGAPYVFWEAPSLFASFAEMYVQDLLFGRPALICTCCGMPFVSSAYQAQYCSLGCRYRKQKRRLRRQMKEAKNLFAQGQSIVAIATALGQEQDIVARWLRGL